MIDTQSKKMVPSFLKKIRENNYLLLKKVRSFTQGQVLVELALVSALFLTLIVGTYDLGRSLHRLHQLTEVAREGVRLASLREGIDTSAAQTEIKQKMETILTDMGIDPATVLITILPVDTGGNADPDVVDVKVEQSLNDVIGPSIIPSLNSLNLEVTLSMPIFIGT